MKHWKVDYSIRYNISGEVEEHDMIVTAMNITEAIEVAAKKIADSLHTLNLDAVIWNVGIIEDDVF